jgi:hypothetical protein
VEDATIWRIRHGLAMQLGQLCYLYMPEEVFQFLCPLALELGTDMVAAVRHAAAEAVRVQTRRRLVGTELVI